MAIVGTGLINIKRGLTIYQASPFYSLKEVITFSTVITAGIHATILKTDVLNHMDRGRSCPVSRSILYLHGQCDALV